jgi:AcrR family transcriptional regulator
MPRPPNPLAPQRLMQAARGIFARFGPDLARIQDITEAAGLSKAAFYLHFESKEHLFDSLVRGLFERLQAISDARHAAFRAIVAQRGTVEPADWDPGSPRLLAYAELDHRYNLQAVEALWEERELIACVLDQATPQRRHHVEAFVELARSTLSQRLSEASATGFVRADVDKELASEMIVGIFLHFARRMSHLTERPDLEGWTRAIDDFVAQGIGRNPFAPPSLETP